MRIYTVTREQVRHLLRVNRQKQALLVYLGDTLIDRELEIERLRALLKVEQRATAEIEQIASNAILTSERASKKVLDMLNGLSRH